MMRLLLMSFLALYAAPPLFAAEPRLTATIDGHPQGSMCMIFSPDGKLLASGSSEKTIALYGVAAGKQVALLEGHGEQVTCLAFSPDGSTLVSGSSDKLIKVWDVATGNNTTTLEGHSAHVRALAVSPDGKTLASGSADAQIKIWDLATGKNTATYKASGIGITSLAFSPDGRTLASGGGGNTVQLWKIADGTSATLINENAEYAPRPIVVFSPDGKTMASGGLCTRNIRLWDVATGKALGSLTPKENPEFGVNSLTFSADGKALCSANQLGNFSVWDLATMQVKTQVTIRDSDACPLAISPGGKTVASESRSGHGWLIRLWDVGRIVEGTDENPSMPQPPRDPAGGGTAKGTQ
jgi:WD40 repeat protein